MKQLLLFLLLIPFCVNAQVSITNTDHYRLTVVKDGVSYVVEKHTVFLTSTEPYLFFYWSQFSSNPNTRNVFRIDFNDVTLPVCISASDLKTQVNAFIYSPVGAGVQYSDTLTVVATPTQVSDSIAAYTGTNITEVGMLSSGALVSGFSTIGIAFGGTGATVDSTARRNLGIYNVIDVYRKLGSPLKTQAAGFPANNRMSTPATVNNGVEVFTAMDLFSGTVSGLMWYKGNTPAYVAGANNKVGLAKDSAGTFVLLASSANDTALWKTGSANTYASKDFITPYTCHKDTVYYGVVLVTLASGTSPTMGATASLGNAGVQMPGTTLSRKICATETGKTDLDATWPQSSATGTAVQIWMGLY